MANADVVRQLVESAEAVGAFAANEDGFRGLVDAFRAKDADSFQRLLGEFKGLDRCERVCHWLISKECVLLCLELCGPPVDVELPDPREFAQVVARITADEELVERLANSVEERDADGFRLLVSELDIERFCHLLCHWVCTVYYRRICRIVCAPRPSHRIRLAEELARAGVAIRKLVANEGAFAEATKAVLSSNCDGFRSVVDQVGLVDDCEFICEWFCAWRCIRVCWDLCRRFPVGALENPLAEAFEFAGVSLQLAAEPAVLEQLAIAVGATDADRFGSIIEERQLERFCIQFCHWICFFDCDLFCICVCPPLVARIDIPAVGACAATTSVGACTPSYGSGPLVGIEITGEADGTGFDHYTLRYSWGANPAVNDAVVYPDCSRPPANPSSNAAVGAGVLGYLDITLLPPGVTGFTVNLDVFDTAAGSASATTSFDIHLTDVAITAVAKVNALDSVDPFILPTPAGLIRVIKAVADPTAAVPEQSVGGVFSVDGSANVIGCSRIMTQFELVHFDAPPAAPVPTPPDATGGAPLVPAVVYQDIPGHPWSSGCSFPAPNIVVNGDLVAAWSTDLCFPGPFTVPKVKGTFWDTTAPRLNGRFVVLLEVRDRPLVPPPPAGFPGAVAATDQVAIWIDNKPLMGTITSIGGISGCGDLKLSDYQTAPFAVIGGIAYDEPIDVTAAQRAPNDNFGSYSLTFKKNGDVSVFGIPALTPNLRVPNVWPGPPVPGTDGVLANWDIVADVDYTGPGPVPEGKLARGTRCAFVLTLYVSDTTHVGDSGGNNTAVPFQYAINVINDL